MDVRALSWMTAIALVTLAASPAVAQDSTGDGDSSDSASASTANDMDDGDEASDEEDEEMDDGSDSGTEEGDESEQKESAHGSYEWKRSYGAGIQYGAFFTGLRRWNTYLMEPNSAPTYETAALSNFNIAVEASLLEGTRVTLFGGIESPFSENPSLLAAYGGIEPAFAFRRNSWELAFGLGVGIGNASVSTDNDGDFSTGLVVLRPTVEIRRYFSERIAAYARFGFNQWLPFSPSSDSLEIEASSENVAPETELQEGGIYAAAGVRFGIYPEHVKVVPDTDGDGFRDDVDDCPEKSEDEDGFEDKDGCPDPDNDDDGVPDAEDDCPDKPEDKDGFEDNDGCPDGDNDGDGIPDAEDECPKQPEDKDTFEDEDGCPDRDNDGDGLADDEDECPDEVGIPSNDGCPAETVSIRDKRLVLDGAIDFEAPDEGDEPEDERPETALTDDAKKQLDTLAEVLKVRTELATVEIAVHTGEGDEDEMKELSKERAKVVRQYLVDAGVEKGRLTRKAHGKSKPAEPEGADEKKPVARVKFHIRERSEPDDQGGKDE